MISEITAIIEVALISLAFARAKLALSDDRSAISKLRVGIHSTNARADSQRAGACFIKTRADPLDTPPGAVGILLVREHLAATKSETIEILTRAIAATVASRASALLRFTRVLAALPLPFEKRFFQKTNAFQDRSTLIVRKKRDLFDDLRHMKLVICVLIKK